MLLPGATTPHLLAVVVSHILDEVSYIHEADDAWFTLCSLLIR